jgi:hypothetical protein
VILSPPGCRSSGSLVGSCSSILLGSCRQDGPVLPTGSPDMMRASAEVFRRRPVCSDLDRPGFHGDLIICLESHHCQRLASQQQTPNFQRVSTFTQVTALPTIFVCRTLKIPVEASDQQKRRISMIFRWKLPVGHLPAETQAMAAFGFTLAAPPGRLQPGTGRPRRQRLRAALMARPISAAALAATSVTPARRPRRSHCPESEYLDYVRGQDIHPG